MAGKTCSQCGAPIDPKDSKCQYCGSVIEKAQAPAPEAPPAVYPAYPSAPAAMPNVYNADGINMSWPIKSKALAGILAIFFGAFGAHKFYLGKTGVGIAYVIMTMTTFLAPITGFIGVIEGISYLVQNEHNFQIKNQVRTR